MIKKRVEELEDAQLDWAVAIALGWKVWELNYPGHGLIWSTGNNKSPTQSRFRPSTDWSQGGPIIYDNLIHPCPTLSSSWVAQTYIVFPTKPGPWYGGKTPLISAMRAFVASKLGDEVEVPK